MLLAPPEKDRPYVTVVAAEYPTELEALSAAQASQLLLPGKGEDARVTLLSTPRAGLLPADVGRGGCAEARVDEPANRTGGPHPDHAGLGRMQH